MKRHPYVIIFLVAALSAGHAVRAQVPDPDPARFAGEIEAFVSWDARNAFPEDGILFVGSSSIRMWPTARAFPGKPVINRGFGGSELSDVVHFYDDVIKPYGPRKFFLYAGDNDIGNGKSPDQVFVDYVELVVKLRADFPDTELIFIAIKPSASRWNRWPDMQETNRKIREYADRNGKLGFADLATPLLDDAGMLRDVYVDDGLHLNEKGYRIWQQALAPFLD